MIEQSDIFCRKILDTYASCIETSIIQPVTIGQVSWRNELVLFIKPEIFMVKEPNQVEQTLNLLFAKLDEFKAYPSGIMIVGGKVLEEKEIMNNHYGFINHLSRTASKILDGNERNKIANLLGLISIADYEILGGHEYLIKYPDEDVFSLDTLWFSKKSIKLRSGFYMQAYVDHGKKIILVNGFHPAQLAHFTDQAHRIVLFLIHSNSTWSVLKNQMIGATFPEKAVKESIRGILYSEPHKFGLNKVSIANNGVHLSAGPFEGAFETVNFFGKILGVDPETNPPLVLQRIVGTGSSNEQALSILRNPILESTDKPIDLFTATEDFDTEDSIRYWERNKDKVIGYSR